MRLVVSNAIAYGPRTQTKFDYHDLQMVNNINIDFVPASKHKRVYSGYKIRGSSGKPPLVLCNSNYMFHVYSHFHLA